jgi:hypothetical protein
MNLKKILLVACSLLALGIGAISQANAEVYVIANASVDLSADEIRDVFLGEKLMVNGVKLVPIDNSAAQTEFFDKVMLLNAAKYSSIWTKKGFRDGLNPPDVKAGDNDVILYVRKTPGAVGYVSALPAATGCKLVKKF